MAVSEARPADDAAAENAAATLSLIREKVLGVKDLLSAGCFDKNSSSYRSLNKAK